MSDKILNRVNAAVGIATGVGAAIFTLTTNLPQPVPFYTVICAIIIVLIPLLTPFSTSRITSELSSTIRAANLASWGITVVLLSMLIVASVIWTSVPRNIEAFLGYGGVPLDRDNTAELSVSRHAGSGYKLSAPNRISKTWGEILGVDFNQSHRVPIVGVLESSGLGSGQSLNNSLRLYPGQLFFNSKTEPIPTFIWLMDAWLSIVLLFQMFLVFLLPLFAKVANGHRNQRSG